MIISSGTEFRRAAKRRLPRFLFDYIDGGSYGEDTLRRNVSDLSDIHNRNSREAALLLELVNPQNVERGEVEIDEHVLLDVYIGQRERRGRPAKIQDAPSGQIVQLARIGADTVGIERIG